MASPNAITREDLRERAREITLAVRRGEPIPEVAKDYGVTVATVYQCCARNGFVVRYSKLGLIAKVAARRAQVLEEAKAGATHREIAAKLGLAEDTIADICTSAGVTLRPVLKRSTLRNLRVRYDIAQHLGTLSVSFTPEQFKVLQQTGNLALTPQEIATASGSTVSHVYQMITLAGRRLVALRKRGELGPAEVVSDEALAALAVRPHDPSRPSKQALAKRPKPVVSKAEAARRAASRAKREPEMTLEQRAERRARIVEAFKSGLSAEQVGAKFGMSSGLVRLAVHESGLGKPDAPTAKIEARRRAIVELARRGNTAKVIAERFDVSEAYVKRLCAQHGVALQTLRERIEAVRTQARHHALASARPDRLLEGKHKAVIADLRDTSLTTAELAAKHGLKPSAVFDIWVKALEEIAVPPGSSHGDLVRARKKVFASGFSIIALSRGRNGKLMKSLRFSDCTFKKLAWNGRTSLQKVMRLWYHALDRAAMAEMRRATTPPSPRKKKRKTKWDDRLLRDLVL